MGTLGKSLPRRSPYRIEAYRGHRFGTRVVEGQAARTHAGQRWLMRCDCGRVDPVTVAYLFRGRAMSCAHCQRRLQAGSAHPAWRGHGAVSSYAFQHARRAAEKRGIAWTISIELLDRLWQEQGGVCPLSGRPLTMKRGNRRPSNCSIDRIDSAVGYVPGNVRWVRKEVNFAKQAMTDAELIELCRDIVGTADRLLLERTS